MDEGFLLLFFKKDALFSSFFSSLSTSAVTKKNQKTFARGRGTAIERNRLPA
jgi:hypothetical protein